MKHKFLKLSIFVLVGVALIVNQLPALATVVAVPTITSITPNSGPIGTRVAILGSGFSLGAENSVIFDGGTPPQVPLVMLVGLASTDGLSLTFELPQSQNAYCPPNISCQEFLPSLVPGNYRVRVLLGSQISNAVTFTVTGNQPQPTPIPNTGTIKIAVVDKSTGTNLVARVEVRNYETGALVATQETAGGSAIFTGLPINSAYAATAIKEGYYQLEKAAFKIGSGFNESVIIFMAPSGARPIPPVPPQPPIEICPFSQFPTLERGVSGETVKKLQEILRLAPNLQTGYFGPLTEQKVKAVERQYGLPETGIVDPDIRPFFFPCYQIVVTAPQAGENWRAGVPDIFYEIRWIIERPSYTIPLGASRLEELSRDVAIPPPTTVAPSPLMPPQPVPATLAIDLVRFGQLAQHITDVTLTSDGSYRWSPPGTIASGQYQIRVSLGATPVLFGQQDLEKRVYLPEWRGWNWDESGVFTIVNEVQPRPVDPQIKLQLQQLLQLVEQMQKLLAAMLANL